jgi:hypothetical protein
MLDLLFSKNKTTGEMRPNPACFGMLHNLQQTLKHYKSYGEKSEFVGTGAMIPLDSIKGQRKLIPAAQSRKRKRNAAPQQESSSLV